MANLSNDLAPPFKLWDILHRNVTGVGLQSQVPVLCEKHNLTVQAHGLIWRDFTGDIDYINTSTNRQSYHIPAYLTYWAKGTFCTSQLWILHSISFQIGVLYSVKRQILLRTKKFVMKHFTLPLIAFFTKKKKKSTKNSPPPPPPPLEKKYVVIEF